MILNALLDKTTLPIRDIITYTVEGTIEINGKTLETEQVINLREGAVALDKNWTYNVIKEQVKYEAIKYGVHSSLSTDMLLMSKAAIWIIDQEKILIERLKGETP